jgi:2'-5' RNA ligase
MPRLFIGTFIAADQQERLGQLAAEDEKLSERWHRKLRWVKPKKLHLTWYFLGTVEEPAIPEIRSRLHEAVQELKRTELSYESFEVWPSPKMPRQLVLTPPVVPDQVQEIVSAIRDSLKGLVPDPDYKSFKPHITLMRFDRLAKNVPKPPPIHLPEEFPPEGIVPIVQKIDEVALIESHLGSRSDEYSAVFSVPLRQEV